MVYTSEFSTEEVSVEICLKCAIGRIHREVGCDKVGGKTSLAAIGICGRVGKEYAMATCEPFCTLGKRPTTLELCQACPVRNEPVVQDVVSEARALLDRLGFAEAHDCLNEAQLRLHAGKSDECVSKSKAALESCMRSILVKASSPATDGADMPQLWKLVKEETKLWEPPVDDHLKQVAGGLASVVQGVGALRSAVGPDHGRTETPPTYDSYAGLALHCAATLCLFLAQRWREVSQPSK